jgi:hypothetical protein
VFSAIVAAAGQRHRDRLVNGGRQLRPTLSPEETPLDVPRHSQHGVRIPGLVERPVRKDSDPIVNSTPAITFMLAPIAQPVNQILIQVPAD